MYTLSYVLSQNKIFFVIYVIQVLVIAETPTLKIANKQTKLNSKINEYLAQDLYANIFQIKNR
ncbi:hypothetical protein CE91St24_15490 [Odoribacteraceae bacterium]|nr:hypothetical protein CE91St21_28780 [Odoribacteraceae bacterium]GKH94308.1 hypothetical protein CE91St23_28040 [Odoribacteraceae bacterium]GKH98809.1 hypothetical protein CE91St22_26870 [Odoribacteraceae bacterium]GKI02274.1 hypothetical protein CE91St24_15490 [Odoribacteraceae bacterium]